MSRISHVRKLRSQKGVLGTVLSTAILLICISFCAFAYDVAHVASVQGELRNASDAGALAGGKALFNNPKKAQSDALAIAALNIADGVNVSNKSKDTTVSVNVQAPPYLLDLNLPLNINLSLTNPFNNPPGTVSVTAAKKVNHIFGRLWGHNSDVISVTSVASMKRPILQLSGNQLFPMAVWVDAVPYNTGIGPVPLTLFRVGDSVNLSLDNPLTGVKGNTTFTGSGKGNDSASVLSAIDQMLGLTNQAPGVVPASTVGDGIKATDSIAIQKMIFSSSRLNALYNQVLVLPIVRDSLSLVKSSTIAGFMGFKVTNVVTDARSGALVGLTGTIVQPIVSGRSDGITNIANLKHDDALLGYAPLGLKLIR